MNTTDGIATIITRQSSLLTHAGDHLARVLRGEPAGLALLHGLRREQERLRAQVHAALPRRHSLFSPADTPAARALLLTGCLVELGDRLETIAMTIRIRPCTAPAFSDAAGALAQAMHVLNGMAIQATGGEPVTAEQQRLFQHTVQVLRDQHWRQESSCADADGAADVVIGCAFAVTLNILNSAAEAILQYAGNAGRESAIAATPVLLGELAVRQGRA